MKEYFELFFTIWLKFFFLLTPFMILSLFLTLTRNMTEADRRKIVYKVTGNVVIVAIVIFFFGRFLFTIFGITLDSFRIGSGALLFLSAVALLHGKKDVSLMDTEKDFTMVPLAVPIIVGPATTGLIMVISAQLTGLTDKMIGFAALLTALICLGIVLLMAASIERLIGRKGIETLTKLTALILAALSAQIIFTGVKNFLSS